MICPYCNKEMTKGIMSGDGRAKVRWKSGDKKAGFTDTVLDSGIVQAARCNPMTGFTLETYFCKPCGKMIFDTTISE